MQMSKKKEKCNSFESSCSTDDPMKELVEAMSALKLENNPSSRFISTTFWPFDEDDETVAIIGEDMLLSAEEFETLLRNHSDGEVESQDPMNTDGAAKTMNMINKDEEELHCAIPDWALSAAVFQVDKPREAVSLGVNLPPMPLSEYYTFGTLLKLSVIEVYSPFQFWFHITDSAMFDLRSLIVSLSMFYGMESEMLQWRLTPYFMQTGFLCVVYHEFVWRRGRIIQQPNASAQTLAVYLVDYARCVDVERKDAYFLNKQFATQPALAVRGTLTDVYPLSSRWPANASFEFVNLVFEHEREALIKDVDYDSCILFVNLYINKDTELSVSDVLIDAKLAGRSQNYSDTLIDANFGRRLRYLRERLPTFEMLETKVFPFDMPYLEDKLDEIIYSHEFFKEYRAPKLSNPFLKELELALANWLIKYERDECQWHMLVKGEAR